MNDTVLINKDVVEQAVESTYHPCTRILIEGLKRLKAWDVLAEWDKAREIVDKRFRTALAEPNRAQKLTGAGYTRRPTLREMAESEPCQYPDCVDNGPDVECTRWLLDECSMREDYKPKRPAEPVQEAEWEVRADGKRVSKDRWQIGIRRIVALLWGNRREFEIDEVIEAVRGLVPNPHAEGDDEARVSAALAEPVEPVQEPPIGRATTDVPVPVYVLKKAEPVQEPVAKVELMMTGGNAGLATRIVEIDDNLRERLQPGQLLYATPPQRKPLTEKQINHILDDVLEGGSLALEDVARAVEAAHGIK